MLLSTLYLFASIYFVLNGKVKTFVFGLICLFMFSRGSLYLTTRFFKDLPIISEKSETEVIYYYFLGGSLITFITGFYFTKQVFFK
jgi:hypothetical protein